MKFFKVLLVSAFLLVLSGPLNAQLCGGYHTILRITDDSGRPIEGVSVQLLPLGEDETRGQTFVRYGSQGSEYIISFQEGHILNESYRIDVSAPLFRPFTTETKFPHCDRRTIDVRMKPVAENKGQLSGTVYDPKGAVIPGAEVSAATADGRIFKTESNEDGRYLLELPSDPTDSVAGNKIARFDIRVKKPGFETSVVMDFRFVSDYNGGMTIDFALDIFVNINTITVKPDS
jgi:hypothetical protein